MVASPLAGLVEVDSMGMVVVTKDAKMIVSVWSSQFEVTTSESTEASPTPALVCVVCGN